MTFFSFDSCCNLDKKTRWEWEGGLGRAGLASSKGRDNMAMTAFWLSLSLILAGTK